MLKRIKGVLFLFIFFTFSTKAQQKQVLSKELKEISGLEIYYDSLLLCHNDSGNKSILYVINVKGKVLKRVFVPIKNTDWEDLCKDNKGNYFLADVGNNLLNRDTLQILSWNEKNMIGDTLFEFSIHRFQYCNYKGEALRLNCESLFYYDNSLFLLTKIENKKDSIQLFKLKIDRKFQKAEFICSFKIPKQRSIFFDAVCSAKCFYEKVYFLTYSALYEISINDLISTNSTKKMKKIRSFPFLSQKEALCVHENQLYIANERSTFIRRQKLHRVKWKKTK
ncbi:MAG: hypothetical protein HYU67_03570 [Flavobacteriia bacterium]|nr:hypothetical protein [Flavobacteriia bacterium]